MALALIAQEMRKGKPVTSGAIAAMVGVHPVHIRRVLGALREAGLVESQPGPAGGWELARDPSEISLYDISFALEPELPFEYRTSTFPARSRSIRLSATTHPGGVLPHNSRIESGTSWNPGSIPSSSSQASERNTCLRFPGSADTIVLPT